MSCGKCCSGGSKKESKATYVCVACGKEEVREAKKGEVVKSCCGKPMKKK